MKVISSMRVDHIAHDGAAEAIHEGMTVRVHGMLPGEVGVVEATRHKGILVGELKELHVASPSRKNPEELHYLSCSPWQAMEYPLQAELKQSILADLYAYYDDAPAVRFEAAQQFFGYRTKVEFSFCDRDGDHTIPLSLAFHVRGGGARRIALPKGCALVSDAMNTVALAICERLRDAGCTASDLKTIIVRESKATGQVLALLFAKNEQLPKISVQGIPHLSGFMAFYSTHRSPASVPTKLMWQEGETHVLERIEDVTITYSWDSFFQNNIPMFTAALQEMRSHVSKEDRVLELYAGAGTIGLALCAQAKSVHGVEIVAGAVESAVRNAKENEIANYTAECLPSEAITSETIAGADVLVLDPPRAGLHPKLIVSILLAQPKTIIYLSCNPETQARDYAELSKHYAISSVTGYDFYPQTPHLESLLVLKLRDK